MLDAIYYTVTSYTFDGSGLVDTAVTEVTGSTSNLLSQSSKTCNELNNPSTETGFVSDPTTYSVTKYFYDDSDMTSMTIIDKNGHVLRQSSMTYDASDNLLIETVYQSFSSEKRDMHDFS